MREPRRTPRGLVLAAARATGPDAITEAAKAVVRALGSSKRTSSLGRLTISIHGSELLTILDINNAAELIAASLSPEIEITFHTQLDKSVGEIEIILTSDERPN